MVLRTKCIYKSRESSDGVRISVMSRHTLSDGFTPDPRISSEFYDEWRKDLAPPAKLVGDWYKRGISWDDFDRVYRKYLGKESVKDCLRELAVRALEHDITILCVEETAERCHRRILAEVCKSLEPRLTVVHV